MMQSSNMIPIYKSNCWRFNTFPWFHRPPGIGNIWSCSLSENKRYRSKGSAILGLGWRISSCIIVYISIFLGFQGGL
ncbi:hypothetical protein BDV33DRAFT_47120 [Aspergillus novoparasiticus]|uniref:Uncharacterized protein n=1 Tax=Aspergillus novoparasiticus TaxID=986946 RepID=A0A5N6F0K4_9EURO|nr:hypothetical protein BDV33DRAFT_47120 [Aspergillus novoparasiticus]